MPELAVRPTLANLHEAEAFQNRDDDPRSQRRNAAHGLDDFECLRPDEGRVQRRLAVLEQHVDDFEQVRPQFVQGGALRVRARPAGNVADEETRVLIPFNHSSIGAHLVLRRGHLKCLRGTEEPLPRDDYRYCQRRAHCEGGLTLALSRRR